MVCIPPSPYQIFYQLFLDLTHYFSTYKGVKILKYDKIQIFQIEFLTPFLTLGVLWSKYPQCEENSFAGFLNTTIVGKKI